MRGGYWWSENVEHNWNKKASNNVRNLSPTENFIRSLYLYNFLLHSKRIGCSSDNDDSGLCLNNDESERLSNLVGGHNQLRNLLNSDNGYFHVFKQELPYQYYHEMSNIIFKRNVVDYSGLLFTDIKFKEVEKFINNRIHDPKMRCSNLPIYQNNNYDTRTVEDILKSPHVLTTDTFEYQYKQLIDKQTLIPCRNVANESWLNTPDSIKKIDRDDSNNHATYVQFMGDSNQSKDFCIKNLSSHDQQLIKDTSKLYWIDMYNLSFKHTRVINEGTIGPDASYSVVSNIQAIDNDPNFFTNLMKNAITGSVIEKATLPINVFIIGDRLYSHDHRRIVSSIGAGNRYILGVIKQDPYIIQQREIGYRPMKCVFSRTDKSMLLFLTKDEIDEYGNYFFVVGEKTDFTPFMMKVFNNAIDLKVLTFDTLTDTNTTGFSTASRLSTVPLDQSLHHPCYPSLFTSLDQTTTLKTWYIQKLNEILSNLGKINTMSQTTSTTYRQKYLKYKKKYLLHKQYAGADKHESSSVCVDACVDACVESRVDTCTELNLFTRLDEIFKTPEKQTQGIKIKKLMNTLCIKDKIKCQEYMKRRCQKKKKPQSSALASVSALPSTLASAPVSSASSDPQCQQTNYAFPNSCVKHFLQPFGLSTDKLQEILKPASLSQVVEIFTEKVKAEITMIDGMANTADLVQWELDNIGNSFWYIFKNKHIHHSIRALIDSQYKCVQPMKTTQTLGIKNVTFYKRITKYNKTNYPELEDVVLILRHGFENGLQSTRDEFKKSGCQLYSIDEIQTWQTTRNKNNNKNFNFITPTNLKKVYPVTCPNGNITATFMDRLVELQEQDHLRIKKHTAMPGKDYYYALQGLSEKNKYEMLTECPRDMNFALHLTNQKIARQILNSEQTNVPHYNTKPGWIELVGRYIHGFGWVVKNDNESYVLDARWDVVKDRLYNRFKDRVGIVIDMAKLYNYYNTKQEQGGDFKWNEVCGINEINTLIFFKPIPPQALVADGRTFDESTVTNPGTPYNIDTLFGKTKKK